MLSVLEKEVGREYEIGQSPARSWRWGPAPKADRQPVSPAAGPAVHARRVPESAAGRGSQRGTGQASLGSQSLRT